MLAVAGGIIIAFLLIQGGRAMLESIAESITERNLKQDCWAESMAVNYSELPNQMAHNLACLDGYSYSKLPENMRREYKQLAWDSMRN